MARFRALLGRHSLLSSRSFQWQDVLSAMDSQANAEELTRWQGSTFLLNPSLDEISNLAMAPLSKELLARGDMDAKQAETMVPCLASVLACFSHSVVPAGANRSQLRAVSARALAAGAACGGKSPPELTDGSARPRSQMAG